MDLISSHWRVLIWWDHAKVFLYIDWQHIIEKICEVCVKESV